MQPGTRACVFAPAPFFWHYRPVPPATRARVHCRQLPERHPRPPLSLPSPRPPLLASQVRTARDESGVCLQAGWLTPVEHSPFPLGATGPYRPRRGRRVPSGACVQGPGQDGTAPEPEGTQGHHPHRLPYIWKVGSMFERYNAIPHLWLGCGHVDVC